MILMKKYKHLLLLLFSVVSLAAGAKDFVKPPLTAQNVMDSVLIDSIQGLYDISQTRFLTCTLGMSYGKYTSIVFADKGGDVDYWLISRPKGLTNDPKDKSNAPIVAKVGCYPGKGPFTYKKVHDCAVTPDECGYDVIPPLYASRLIIYKDAKDELYFEGDSETLSYAPSIKKAADRNEWIRIINVEIGDIIADKK